jgi:Mrp family chromosome partitioning ATPase
LIALVLGALVASGLAYLLDAVEARRIRRQRPFGSLPLAEIPDFARSGPPSKLPVLDAPTSKAAEAVRLLAAIVGLPRVSEQGSDTAQDEPSVERRTVAFVSSGSGEGTTTVAANTAVAAAQAGKNVLVLDADLRAHGLMRLLVDRATLGASGANAPGSMRQDGPSPESTTRLFRTENGGSLKVIQAGSSNPDAISAIWTGDVSGEQFDSVFIDVPPVLQFRWVEVLLERVDGVVVVARHRGDIGRTEQLLDRFELVGIRWLGHVYNFVPPSESRRPGLISSLLARWRARRPARAPSQIPPPVPRVTRPEPRPEPVIQERAAPSPSAAEPGDESLARGQGRRWA